MTDKQILELAAKAAGIKLQFDPHGLPRNCTDMEPAMNIFAAKLWNPLEDDGDALRLAVDLGIDVCQTQLDFYNEHCSDDYAGTRYAITCSAAEIGLHKSITTARHGFRLTPPLPKQQEIKHETQSDS